MVGRRCEVKFSTVSWFCCLHFFSFTSNKDCSQMYVLPDKVAQQLPSAADSLCAPLDGAVKVLEKGSEVF
jgi:hypothetical protein